jgi:hypothetical protein
MATGMPTRRMWTWAVGGLVLTLLAWVMVVPWDLSVDASGGGGDDYATRIGLVLLVVTVAAVSLVLSGQQDATWLGTAAAVTWAFLFAWRAAVSETNGANLWPIAFVFIVLPAAAVSNRWSKYPLTGGAIAEPGTTQERGADMAPIRCLGGGWRAEALAGVAFKAMAAAERP